MALDVLRQHISNTCLLQAHWSLARIEIFHIRQQMLILILVEDTSQRVMFLHILFLAVSELTTLEIVHDVEVLCGFVLEVKFVNGLVVGLRVENDVAPVIVVSEYILCRIDEHFDLISHFDFETNQRHIELVVENHADFLEFESFKLLVLEWHPIQFVLNAGQIVKLPCGDIIEAL